MKKLLPFFLLCAYSAMAAGQGDFVKGLDLTGTNRISASALNQLVDNGHIAPPKGIVFTTNNALDLATFPYQSNFVWRDISLGYPGTLKTWSGSAWVAATIGVGGVGSINLAQASVTAGKLDQNSVNTTNISDNAVTDTKINAGAVTSNKLASASVTSDKIVDGTIATVDIGANQITTALIADSQITSSKIANNAVLTTNILDGAVTTAKILDGNVTAAKLASAAALGYVLRFNGTTHEWALPYCLQETRSVSNALFTSGSIAAIDDTTLTLPETTNVLSVTITPLRSDTFIVVEATISFSVSASTTIAAGIFRDGAATASSVSFTTVTASPLSGQLKLYSKFSSTSTAASTFNIRLGQDAGSVYINGRAAGRLFGGTAESWVVVREVNQ